jgi:hypothetical protein
MPLKTSIELAITRLFTMQNRRATALVKGAGIS